MCARLASSLFAILPGIAPGIVCLGIIECPVVIRVSTGRGGGEVYTGPDVNDVWITNKDARFSVHDN